MKRVLYYFVFVLLVAMQSCQIEDDYCGRLHPHEVGLQLNVVSQSDIEGDVRYLIYKSGSGDLVRDTTCYVSGTEHLIDIYLEYGSYEVIAYEMATAMVDMSTDSYYDAYQFVITDQEAMAMRNSESDSELDNERRIIGDAHINIGDLSLLYDNSDPHPIFDVPIAAKEKRVNFRINFVNDKFDIAEVERCSATLDGIASVLGWNGLSVMRGNPAMMNIEFTSTPPEGHPDEESPDPNKLYATIWILGNDLDSVSDGDLLNSLVMTVDYYLDDSESITYELSSVLGGIDNPVNINIDVDLESNVGSSSGIIVDETWLDDIIVPIGGE